MYADLCGVLKYLTLLCVFDIAAFLCLDTIARSMFWYVEHAGRIDN